MIQPLKTPKSGWNIFWIDLDEPIPNQSGDYFLPTLLVVTDLSGVPIAKPEILEELDQIRVENFLVELLERGNPPAELLINENPEWDAESWRNFGEDYRVKIRFAKFDPRELNEILAVTHTIKKIHAAGRSQPGAKIVAAGLVNTAGKLRSDIKRRQLYLAALARDADCSPARIELADIEFRRGDLDAALREYDTLLDRESGRLDASSPNWWADLTTRPFLRAAYGRAMTLWHKGQYDEAAQTLSQLLETNPADHQGVRFLLPLIWMLAEDYDEAQNAYATYAKNYPGDFEDPALQFGWGLMHSHFGRDPEAREHFKTGIYKNLYIAPYVLEISPPSESLWSPSDRTDPGYAREFLESYSVLWERIPSAIRTLRETWEAEQPRIQKLIAHRAKISEFQDQRYDRDYKTKWQALVAEDERLCGGGE